NIFKKIEDNVKDVISKLQAEKLLPESIATDKVEATPARDVTHGDVATNVAMVLAAQVGKILGKNPKEIAAMFVDKLQAVDGIDKVEIAGAGFINMTLAPSVWQSAVLDIISEGRGYGNSDIGSGKRVNVEYVSANPTGPMHVGHGRGAVFGDALATLLIKAGYDVTREYYINDAGAQVDKLAESVFLRYREVCGQKINGIPEGLYPGEYLIPIAESLHAIHGKDLLEQEHSQWLSLVRDYTIEAVMIMVKEDLSVIGIEHNIFTSERAITEAGEVEQAIAVLENKGLIYEGVLEPPKGKMLDDWEARPQTLFKSTQFGDDCDRPVKKSDGSWTYFAPDIAYHYDKCKRGFDWLINVFGADHGGYVKRIKAAVGALSDNKVAIDIKLCQLVKFLRDGQPAKMSKRAGTFVTVREVVDEVGKDVFRFIMLTRKNDAPLDFDFAKVTEQSKDNPVFYVQYAHARARSIRRNVAAEMPEAMQLAQDPTEKLLTRLSHPQELSLIRLMCSWPRVVESAAVSLEPHRIAFYLHDLAAAFHGLWNQGNGDGDLRFIIKDDIELTAARVALAHSLSFVIASGLMVLGVEAVEEMR
ncbi:MAG: arginine--tRNA ligase, partial [Rickettsiales bacterium]